MSNWNSHSGTELPQILLSLVQTGLENIAKFVPRTTETFWSNTFLKDDWNFRAISLCPEPTASGEMLINVVLLHFLKDRLVKVTVRADYKSPHYRCLESACSHLTGIISFGFIFISASYVKFSVLISGNAVSGKFNYKFFTCKWTSGAFWSWINFSARVSLPFVAPVTSAFILLWRKLHSLWLSGFD